MNFDVAGPFKITRHGKNKMIIDESLVNLKNSLDNSHPGLADACGCYVFAIRAGRGFTPYYVGQSCKSSILKEALNPTNREKYNKVCQDGKGTPVLFILPMLTPNRHFRQQSSKPLASVIFLERWLIAAAIEKNQDLINNKETKFLRTIRVTGIFNAERGEASTSSKLLARALW